MPTTSWSERYAIAAVLLLLVLVLADNARVMLIISIIGLAAGFWVARQGELRRVAMVAIAAFAMTLVIAAFTLLR